MLRSGASVCDIKITTTRICVALRVLQAGTVKGCNRAMLILITRLGRRPADPNSTPMLNSSESRGAGRSVRANFNFRLFYVQSSCFYCHVEGRPERSLSTPPDLPAGEVPTCKSWKVSLATRDGAPMCGKEGRSAPASERAKGSSPSLRRWSRRGRRLPLKQPNCI